MPKSYPKPKTKDELHPLVLQILENRKIASNISDWLDPSFSDVIHNPFLFSQMEEFVDRLVSAVEEKEQIAIFSDFDTDGIPAAVMWHDLFVTIGYENFEIYIPKRDLEGFGLKPEQVKKFVASGTDLLITTDCGIRSHEAVGLAKKEGVDVMIADHHVPADTVPEADVILNPALKDEEYPCSDLCGAGVVFKILQALSLDGRLDLPKNFAKGQLGMVAIATVGDMVPLVGENRYLAKFGLEILRSTNRPGLRALYEKGRIQGSQLTEVDIGFTIGSHVNAASRLDSPRLAFLLLATRNHQEGKELAGKLHKIYQKRKRQTASLKKSVTRALAGAENGQVVACGSPDWKPALLGPVAYRVAENKNQPVFLWGEVAGRKKGSARSVNHDVVSMLQAVADTHLKTYGGHKMAGGFELTDGTSPEFADSLAGIVDQFQLETKEETAALTAQLSDLSWPLYGSLEAIGPFGMANEQPLFRITDVTVSAVRKFGAGDEHVAITITDGKNETEAVCFFATDRMKHTTVGETIAVTGALEKSTFGFQTKLRFRMEKIERLRV